MAEHRIGVVIHYWSKVGVAGLSITDGVLSVGDSIHIKGHTSDFTQRVDSIQIENEAVEFARPGDEVGVIVTETVRTHDEVFKMTSD
jgi:putative protease